MSGNADDDITQLLAAVRAGDVTARDRLTERVYAEFHWIAERLLARERVEHTLQPTDLLHDAFVRLFGSDLLEEATNRAYLFGAATRAMRRILIDHARRRKAAVRGGDRRQLPFDLLIAYYEEQRIDIDALRDALETLATIHERAAQVITLRAVGGFTAQEVATQLGVSLSTVEKDSHFARTWLFKQLGVELDADRT